MTNYIYACGSCGMLFEFEAAPEELGKSLTVVCPSCQSEKTYRTSKKFEGRSGSYKYSKTMNRVVRVSDKISGLTKGDGSGSMPVSTCSTGTCNL